MPLAQGPGAGGYNNGQAGAGSYGGIGGFNTNGASSVYGSFTQPVDFGSGGGYWRDYDIGGDGGGAVRIHAAQIQIDGVIFANGQGIYANGSGGSIYITTGVLSGNGTIRGNGGDQGMNRGGGGRVAIYYDDKSGFGGSVQARGGIYTNINGTINQGFGKGGGAGTVYWKKNSDAFGDLIIDNGGVETTGWSTPLFSQGILRLNSWTISGNARVSTTAGVRVANGNPAQFNGLITNNYLQVGGLLVSNTWVFGDVMDLEIRRQETGIRGQESVQALVTVYCRPQKTYLLLASTNFLDWIPVATNTPTGSRFDYLDTEAPLFRQRHFRAAMIEHLYDSLGISLEGIGAAAAAPYRARLTVAGAQPAGNATPSGPASAAVDPASAGRERLPSTIRRAPGRERVYRGPLALGPRSPRISAMPNKQ